jgi:hypothetical protein
MSIIFLHIIEVISQKHYLNKASVALSLYLKGVLQNKINLKYQKTFFLESIDS